MDDSGVLFCSRTEVYFGLNAVGVKIWDQLPEQSESGIRTFDELITVLSHSYPGVSPEVLATDAAEFLAAMAAGELVVSP